MPTEKRLRQKEARRIKLEQQRKKEQRGALRKRVITIVGVAAVVLVTAIWIFSSNSSNSTSTSTSSTTTSAASHNGGAISQAQANQAAIAAGCPADPHASANTLKFASEPALSINTAKSYSALFHTTAGDFTVALDAAAAPHTVNSFVFLAQHGFYHCVIFHRAIPGFMIQGGDPTGTGMGGPGYTIPDENFPAATAQYPLYSLAMANTGQAHSGGSQFFIITGSEGQGLPHSYSLFGQVTSGSAVVQAINNAGDPNGNTDSSNGTTLTVTHRILSITITEK